MYGDSFSGIAALVRSAGAALLVAFAVRWLDDYIDGHGGGPGAPPGPAAAAPLPVYGLVALALACGLDGAMAVPLFFAGYGTGMLGTGAQRLASGLAPWQESVLAFGFCLWATGWVRTLAAFGCVAAIQAADDLRDVGEDARRGASNWARQWGPWGAALAGLTGLSLAAFLDAPLVVLAFVAAAAVEAAGARRPGRPGAAGGGGGGPAL